MSRLPTTLARVLGAGVGVPAVSCAALLLASPSLVPEAAAPSAVTLALAARQATDALAVMGVATLAAALAAARGARVGADARARQELVAIPRALSMTWGALAAMRFAEGALSTADDARGALSLAAAAVMALAAVAMHPALRHAVRPALDDARLDHVPASSGERLALRTAVAVGVPCGAAALLAMLAVGAQSLHLSRAQGQRAAATWSALVALPAAADEPADGPALAAWVLSASGALGVGREAGNAPDGALPSRAWTVAVALAAGALGALIGRRVGRDAARTLSLAADRIDALSDGARTHAATSETPSTDAVPEVDALVRSLDALAASLASMTTDQARALSARREAARLRSLVFAGVSHDLRGPLNAVLGFAGILELGADGPLTGGQRESVDALSRGGRELLRLVDDLLDAARIEAGRLRIEAAPAPLTELIADATRDADARARAADAGDALVAVEQVPELSVRIERGRAAAALGALLAYARLRPGARRDGVVSLRIATVAQGEVCLRIHGPGSTPDEGTLAGVLEPFDLPPQGARARAGLGLAVGVAARVIALHNGAVVASAAPEGGLLFTVTLPVA